MGIKRVYLFKDGKCIEVTPRRKKRLHYVQQDTIDPIVSHVDGKVYDSKSALRQSYREHGAEELGDISIKDIEKSYQDFYDSLERKQEKQIEHDLREVVTQGPAAWEKVLGHD